MTECQKDLNCQVRESSDIKIRATVGKYWHTEIWGGAIEREEVFFLKKIESPNCHRPSKLAVLLRGSVLYRKIYLFIYFPDSSPGSQAQDPKDLISLQGLSEMLGSLTKERAHFTWRPELL